MPAFARYDFVYPKTTWDKAAAGDDGVYDAICHGWDKERFETERQSLFFAEETPADAVVVDLGCGIGRVARWVAPRVAKYIGIDYSRPMISRARQYNAGIANATFLVSDSLAILPDDSVDLVFSEQVFIHLRRSQQLRYLMEAYDVVRPGGRVLAAVPDEAHYVNGFKASELMSLMLKFHGRATAAGLCFILHLTKPAEDQRHDGE